MPQRAKISFLSTGFCTSLAFLLSMTLSPSATAGGDAAKIPLAPLAHLYPDTEGILFPGLHVAAGTNPASLGRFKKSKSFGLSYSPSLYLGEIHSYIGSFAYTTNKFGMGLGVTGNYYNGENSNGALVGLGHNFGFMALGLTIRETSFSGYNDPNADLGLIIGEPKALNFGLVLYHLESSAQPSLSIGYVSGKKFTLEINTLLPSISDLTESWATYRFSVAANIFIDTFSLYFRTAYTTGSNELTHTLALGTWLGESFNIMVQYTFPRVWTVGLNLSF